MPEGVHHPLWNFIWRICQPPVIVSYSENFRPLKTHQGREIHGGIEVGGFLKQGSHFSGFVSPVESTNEISSACTVTRAHVHTAAARYATGNMKARVTRLLLHPRSSELDLLFVSRGAAMFHSHPRRNVAVIRRPSSHFVGAPGLTFVASSRSSSTCARQVHHEIFLQLAGSFNRVKFVSRSSEIGRDRSSRTRNW